MKSDTLTSEKGDEKLFIHVQCSWIYACSWLENYEKLLKKFWLMKFNFFEVLLDFFIFSGLFLSHGCCLDLEKIEVELNFMLRKLLGRTKGLGRFLRFWVILIDISLKFGLFSSTKACFYILFASLLPQSAAIIPNIEIQSNKNPSCSC